MEKKETKPLKITTLNVKNIESNMQYVYSLLKSTDILCLQETWLFNFQLRQLGEIHKNFLPSQKPRGYGGVATLYRKNMDLRVRKCLDGGCRIVVIELVTDPPVCVINVYMPCRNGRSSDDFQSILLEVQEIVAKFSPTHAIFLLGDMNSSLQKRDNNLHDRELENFCMRNGLSSLQRGTPTFFHVNTKDTAEIRILRIQQK